MSELDKLLEASKSAVDVHKFIVEFIKSHELRAAEDMSNLELVQRDMYDVFEKRLESEMEPMSNKWKVDEMVELCNETIKLSRHKFYKLLSHKLYYSFYGNDRKSFNEFTPIKLEQFKIAFEHNCEKSFMEMLLNDARYFFFEMDTFLKLVTTISGYAAKYNRVDVLKLLYTKYGWNSSTTECDSLSHAIAAGHLDVVKWILETFSPITAEKGHHYCPRNAFLAATKNSDTKILKWLMDKCCFLPLSNYFVSEDFPFFDHMLRMKGQALLANELLLTSATSSNEISDEALALLNEFVVLYNNFSYVPKFHVMK